jgi:hypothetical protein
MVLINCIAYLFLLLSKITIRYLATSATIYIYSLLLFITKNKDEFLLNSQVHRIDTRQNSNLYLPSANLTIYQSGVYYAGIKTYNHLPSDIKNLSNDKNKFKLALKRYLLYNSFHGLEEYFNK